jgi:hypothetical protein
MTIDLRSLTGGISIGLDRSGAFAVSPLGLAVRDSNDRLKARTAAHEFIDVTELAWSLHDAEGWVLRVPVPLAEVEQGDLVIIEEAPVRVILVQGPGAEYIAGITADGEVIEYRPAPSYFVRRPMVVKVISAFELFGDGGDPGESLPLLALALGRGGGDPGASLLLASALRPGGGARGGHRDWSRLLLLLLLAGRDRSGGSLDVLLLSSLFRDWALPSPPSAPVTDGHEGDAGGADTGPRRPRRPGNRSRRRGE